MQTTNKIKSEIQRFRQCVKKNKGHICSVALVLVSGLLTTSYLMGLNQSKSSKMVIFVTDLPTKILVQAIVGDEADVITQEDKILHHSHEHHLSAKEAIELKRSDLIIYFSRANNVAIHSFVKRHKKRHIEIVETNFARKVIEEAKSTKAIDQHFWITPQSTSFAIECLAEAIQPFIKDKNRATENTRRMLVSMSLINSQFDDSFGSKRLNERNRLIFTFHGGYKYISSIYNIPMYELLSNVEGVMDYKTTETLLLALKNNNKVCILIDKSHFEADETNGNSINKLYKKYNKLVRMQTVDVDATEICKNSTPKDSGNLSNCSMKKYEQFLTDIRKSIESCIHN